jgi:hypothetical protein
MEGFNTDTDTDPDPDPYKIMTDPDLDPRGRKNLRILRIRNTATPNFQLSWYF